MKNIILVGFGGHAKSVADCIERANLYNIVGYTDFEEHNSKYSYLGSDDSLQSIFDSGVKYAAIGIGYMGKGSIREKLYYNLKSIGFELPVIIDPSSVISDTSYIGEGTFVGKGAIINAEAVVGKMVIINTKAIIEHECVIEDYVHIAVGAVLCGQVKIGKSSFIGANSTIIQCRTVEQNKIIPAGFTVR